MIWKHFSECKSKEEKIALLREEENDFIVYLWGHVGSFESGLSDSGVKRQMRPDIKEIVKLINKANLNIITPANRA